MDAGRGCRVVASPEPKRSSKSGFGACSTPVTWSSRRGGGIPVGRRGTIWDGVDAVIDKDYAAAELAHQLSADALVLITGVDAVLLDYGQPSQRRATYLDANAAEQHLADGQFPEGSMGPKVRAATRFVRHGGRVAVITTAALVERTLRSQDRADQSVGTRIVPADDRAGAIA